MQLVITLVAGVRFQTGEFHTSNRFDNEPGFVSSLFANPPAQQDFNTSLRRQSYYIYDTWRPFAPLSITGGVTYDRLSYPQNYRNSPILDSASSTDRISPKAGFIWNPFGHFAVRGAYSRSLGGVSFDESILLEPTQVAGFNQVFRDVISESLVGSVAAPSYENAGLLVEDKLPTGTYLGVQASILKSDISRNVGIFDAHTDARGNFIVPIVPSDTPQKLGYEEDSLTATINQIVGEEWSFGARYRVSFSDLQTVFPEANAASGIRDTRQKATFHQADVYAIYNHPSGFFAKADAYWARQSNVGYGSGLAGDEFTQFNVAAGFRFRRNFGEVSLALLNIGGEDYNLNPLNYHTDLPRDRTLLVRVKFNF